jgi:hypothetical protein
MKIFNETDPNYLKNSLPNVMTNTMNDIMNIDPLNDEPLIDDPLNDKSIFYDDPCPNKSLPLSLQSFPIQPNLPPSSIDSLL